MTLGLHCGTLGLQFATLGVHFDVFLLLLGTSGRHFGTLGLHLGALLPPWGRALDPLGHFLTKGPKKVFKVTENGSQNVSQNRADKHFVAIFCRFFVRERFRSVPKRVFRGNR